MKPCVSVWDWRATSLSDNAVVGHKGRFLGEIAKCFYGYGEAKRQKMRFCLRHCFYAQVETCRRFVLQTLGGCLVGFWWGGGEGVFGRGVGRYCGSGGCGQGTTVAFNKG